MHSNNPRLSVGNVHLCFCLIVCTLLCVSTVATSPTYPSVEIVRSYSDVGTESPQITWHRDNFTKTAQFFATLQGVDGGEMEAEDNPFENTDNTLESIWVWCRYYELTGDNQYYPYVMNAWNYSIAHPAWLEDDSGKIYSSSWALVAEQRFRTVYNDWTYSWYANASLQFITNETGWEPAFFTAVTKVHIRGWAAGNVYRYSLFTGNDTARALALQMGNLTMSSIEANPTYLSTQGWALAGGTSMWGIWQSSMQENPDPSWMLTYGPLLSTEVTSPGMGGGQSQVGWEAWYAGGHLGIWDITGEDIYYLNYLNITDRQIAADGDDDGGLPTNYGEPDDTDESWVTSYRAYMILDEFERMPQGNPPRDADLQMAEIFGSDVLLDWSLSPDDAGGEMDVFAYEIYYSTNVQACEFGTTNFTLLDIVYSGTSDYIHSGAGSDLSNYIYYIGVRDYQAWRNASSVFAGKCSLHLDQGKNLMSIPFQTLYTDLSYVFQAVPLNSAWAYDFTNPADPWDNYDSSKPFADLSSIDETMGLWVDTASSTDFAVAGLIPQQPTIQIRSGWNLVGFPSKTNRTVGDLLSGISYDRVEVFDPLSPIYNLKPVGDTHMVQVGEALWIHALADGVIQIQN